MFDGLRRGFFFNNPFNNLSSISNRNDGRVFSGSSDVGNNIFFASRSNVWKYRLQITIRINFIRVVVIFPISIKQSLFHWSVGHEWKFLNIIFRTIWIIGCENLNKFFMWFNRSGFLRFIKILINSIFSRVAW